MSQKNSTNGLLTKEAALRYCHDLWQFLALNPESGKRGWPGLDGKLSYNFASGCPCCQFVTEQSGHGFISCCNRHNAERQGYEHKFAEQIELCPLKNLWPNGCTAPSSPYIKWSRTFVEETRAQAAQQIADAAKRELQNLGIQI